MNSEHYDVIHTIADALYRSTGAVPFTLTANDVRTVAECQGHVEPLSDAECREILDSMIDAVDFDPLIVMAITTHFDRQEEAPATGLLRDIRLKLSEIEGSFSITEGAKP